MLTQPGQVHGNARLHRARADPRRAGTPATDIYALGCVAFECLAGEAPFADQSLFEVAMAHLEEAPPDASERRAEVPRPLSDILRQAMAKEPAQRPRTGTAFAHLLRAASR